MSTTLEVEPRPRLDAGAPLVPLWPPDEEQRIAWMDLTSVTLEPNVRELLPKIERLALLADAIRPLQTTSGGFADDEVASAALASSADTLFSMAGALPYPLSEVTYLRATSLRDRRAHTAAAMRHVSVLEQPLVVIVGPMSTWRSKTTAAVHSMVAAVPDRDLDALVARADERLPAVLDRLRVGVGLPGLRLGPVPGFFVTSLFACGGEANAFPKHFSYFLPEDEGVKRAPEKKTLVFANVYRERFLRTSQLLGEALLRPVARPDPDQAIVALLLWFRGHDVGHSLLLPATDYRKLRQLGRETSVMLQEAIADVMGFLAAASQPWSELGLSLDPTLLGSVFLSELLRYVRRGPTWFPDSAAAYLELSYLLEQGFVARQADRLSWKPDRLLDGMARLGRDLCDVVLAGDLELGRELLRRHSWSPEHHLDGELSHLRSGLRHVPTALAYRQSWVSGREA